MRTKAFQQFLAQITKLTPTQRKQVLDNIQKMDNTEIVEDVLNTTDHCHYCGSNNFIKWGLNSNIQRYKCKDCKKTFNGYSFPKQHTIPRFRHSFLKNLFFRNYTPYFNIKS